MTENFLSFSYAKPDIQYQRGLDFCNGNVKETVFARWRDFEMMPMRSTTIVAVKRNEQVAMAGDGQVTLGETIVKQSARKIRRLYKDKVLAGFAGSVADALALFQRFEEKLEEFRGDLKRAAVELARDWRTDRVLRRLEALMIVADLENLLLITGAGEVIEPDGDEKGSVLAIGSGGPYAAAAAKALLKFTDLDAPTIASEALKIAASLCVYTNDQIILETLP